MKSDYVMDGSSGDSRRDLGKLISSILYPFEILLLEWLHEAPSRWIFPTLKLSTRVVASRLVSASMMWQPVSAVYPQTPRLASN